MYCKYSMNKQKNNSLQNNLHILTPFPSKNLKSILYYSSLLRKTKYLMTQIYSSTK